MTLALKPIHHREVAGGGFMASLEEAVSLIEEVDEAGLGLALDLWSFADDTWLSSGMEQFLQHVRLVLVADRNGPLHEDQERLPPGGGNLPLKQQLASLLDAGYQGDIEIDPVGERVMQTGYEETLAAIGRYAAGFQRQGQHRISRQAASWSPLATAGGQVSRP